ncbi:hypothetical protein D3C86_1699480 [compost metagenome]
MRNFNTFCNPKSGLRAAARLPPPSLYNSMSYRNKESNSERSCPYKAAKNASVNRRCFSGCTWSGLLLPNFSCARCSSCLQFSAESPVISAMEVYSSEKLSRRIKTARSFGFNLSNRNSIPYSKVGTGSGSRVM